MVSGAGDGALESSIASPVGVPDGFQIVSEKFYTVDDFNTHITKCNTMVRVWYLASS